MMKEFCLSLQFYGGSHPLLTFIYNKNSVSRSKHTPPTFKEKSPHQGIKQQFQSVVLKRRLTEHTDSADYKSNSAVCIVNGLG